MSKQITINNTFCLKWRKYGQGKISLASIVSDHQISYIFKYLHLITLTIYIQTFTFLNISCLLFKIAKPYK